MANILLSCWEYSRYHKQVLPVAGFWQFDRIVDSKVGFNPPFHYHVVPWIDLILAASNKQLFTTHEKRSRTNYFSYFNCYPIRIFGGGDWLERCYFAIDE